LLLTAGSDVNATNSAGEQPIDAASANPNSDEIIQILRTAGATGGRSSDGASTTPDAGRDEADDGAQDPIVNVPRPPEARKILYSEQRLPANAGGATVTFRGYESALPTVFDRRLRSRENPQDVTLFLDNWYPETVELFKIRENGQPEPAGRIEPYTSLDVPTNQGTVFVAYGVDGTYFGSYTTVGVREQRVRTEP